MKSLFNLLDVDNSQYIDKMELLDGILNRQDVVRIMKGHKKLELLLQPGTFESSFHDLNTHRDGHVTLNELIDFVIQHHDKTTVTVPDLPISTMAPKTNTKSIDAYDKNMDSTFVPPSLRFDELNGSTNKNNTESFIRPRVEIYSGKTNTSDDRQRNVANKFLVAMRAKSTAAANTEQRKLVTGLCDTLSTFESSKTRRKPAMTVTENLDLDEVSTFERQQQRFPPVKNASPRQQQYQIPSSPKMSRISFSK